MRTVVFVSLARHIGVILAAMFILAAPYVNAAGLRVGVVRMEPTRQKVEDRKLAVLVANDVLPQILEKAFARFGVTPIILPILGPQQVQTSSRPDSSAFDVIITPEITEIGGEYFFALKVADQRLIRTAQSNALEQTFTALPDASAGIRGIEGGLRGAAERIAAAVVGGRTSYPTGSAPPTRDLQGLIYVWCIVPDPNSGAVEQMLSTDLTVSLPFALSEAAAKKGLLASFVGLGHRDYYYECRENLAAGGSSRVGPREVDGTYTVSGQLLQAPNKDVWLRLFAEDRSIGQTRSLAPIRVLENSAADPLEAVSRNRKSIAEAIIENLMSVTRTSP
jgi:hypothetical protein